ncbi:hypothetical protein [Sphingobacterium bovistauri]|uniref:WG containing repeat-containing protein n=1 Tax=Sphingobacterium bovistauri TaxID=2781959 RepID=A0ABS7Z994_9SPHI|nr:hypothetical protein [Sphingobacterium bovistauri]MCA5006773.1 hypothetical protein [Sphingobacterium bovistauri]
MQYRNLTKLLYLLIIYFLLICTTTYSQEVRGWTKYIKRILNPNNPELIGYMDHKGDTVLKAIYHPVFSHSIIKDVGAVWNTDPKVGSFYFNRKGKIFGRDSTWAWDFSYDVESEGFIRFSIEELPGRNPHCEGMFDWKGSIRIPANYNELSSMKNGFVHALKDARREPLEPGSEYYKWVGGKQLLLDSNNNILVSDQQEMMKVNEFIDYYSFKIVQDTIVDNINIKMDKGKYLSFNDVRKEFLNQINLRRSVEKLLLDSLIIDNKAVRKSDFLTLQKYRSLKKNLEKPLNIRYVSLSQFPNFFDGDDSGSFLLPFIEMNSPDEYFRKHAILDLLISDNLKQDFVYQFVRVQKSKYKLIQISEVNR